MALELGPGVFSGRTLLQLDVNVNDQAREFLQHSKQALTSSTMHITLGYLPDLPASEFFRLEQKLVDMLQGWKQDLAANDFSPANAPTPLALLPIAWCRLGLGLSLLILLIGYTSCT